MLRSQRFFYGCFFGLLSMGCMAAPACVVKPILAAAYQPIAYQLCQKQLQACFAVSSTPMPNATCVATVSQTPACADLKRIAAATDGALAFVKLSTVPHNAKLFLVTTTFPGDGGTRYDMFTYAGQLITLAALPAANKNLVAQNAAAPKFSVTAKGTVVQQSYLLTKGCRACAVVKKVRQSWLITAQGQCTMLEHPSN